MKARKNKTLTEDTLSGCDLIMISSPLDEKTIADLPSKSNEVYVRGKDSLFYVNKAEKKCIEIKLTLKNLKRVADEMKPASIATTLTKAQLKRIQSITDDAVLGHTLNSAMNAYKEMVSALLNTLSHQQKMTHEQEEADKKEKQKEIINAAVLLQNKLKINEIKELLTAMLAKEAYILSMIKEYDNVHLKILLQEQDILKQIDALHKAVLEQINKEIKKNEERIRELQNSIAASHLFIANLEKTIKEREERINKEMIHLAELNEKIKVMTKDIEARDERIAARDERIAARDERIAARDQRIAAREKRIAAREESIATREKNITKDEARLVELKESISARQARIDARDAENARDLAKLEKLKEHFLQHKHIVEHKTKNIDMIDQSVQQIQADIAHEKEELDRLKLDRSNIQVILSELHEEQDQIIKKILPSAEKIFQFDMSKVHSEDDRFINLIQQGLTIMEVAHHQIKDKIIHTIRDSSGSLNALAIEVIIKETIESILQSQFEKIYIHLNTEERSKVISKILSSEYTRKEIQVFFQEIQENIDAHLFPEFNFILEQITSNKDKQKTNEEKQIASKQNIEFYEIEISKKEIDKKKEEEELLVSAKEIRQSNDEISKVESTVRVKSDEINSEKIIIKNEKDEAEKISSHIKIEKSILESEINENIQEKNENIQEKDKNIQEKNENMQEKNENIQEKDKNIQAKDKLNTEKNKAEESHNQVQSEKIQHEKDITTIQQEKTKAAGREKELVSAMAYEEALAKNQRDMEKSGRSRAALLEKMKQKKKEAFKSQLSHVSADKIKLGFIKPAINDSKFLDAPTQKKPEISERSSIYHVEADKQDNPDHEVESKEKNQKLSKLI